MCAASRQEPHVENDLQSICETAKRQARPSVWPRGATGRSCPQGEGVEEEEEEEDDDDHKNDDDEGGREGTRGKGRPRRRGVLGPPLLS
eukprot:4778189-Pyramimonas_sp.AAC.1